MIETELSKMTGAQQIAVMQNLSQQAAAWLVGATARTVRDHVEIPRDAGSRYNAQNLVTWAASRVPLAELAVEDLERTLNAADLLFDILSDRNGEAAVALADLLQYLRTRYGEGGLAVFTQEMARQLRQRADQVRTDWQARKRLPADRQREFERRVEERRRSIEREVEEELAAEETWRAEVELDFVVVCDDCGRLRRGWEWVEADPPPGRHVVRSCCPDYKDCAAHKLSKSRHGK